MSLPTLVLTLVALAVLALAFIIGIDVNSTDGFGVATSKLPVFCIGKVGIGSIGSVAIASMLLMSIGSIGIGLYYIALNQGSIDRIGTAT